MGGAEKGSQEHTNETLIAARVKEDVRNELSCVPPVPPIPPVLANLAFVSFLDLLSTTFGVRIKASQHSDHVVVARNTADKGFASINPNTGMLFGGLGPR